MHRVWIDARIRREQRRFVRPSRYSLIKCSKKHVGIEAYTGRCRRNPKVEGVIRFINREVDRPKGARTTVANTRLQTLRHDNFQTDRVNLRERKTEIERCVSKHIRGIS